MKNNNVNNINKMVTTAILTAIAIIIPMFMPGFPPFKFVFPPFTATLASHVPLILAMFISPGAAVFTALGSAFGFLFAFPDPTVAARAAMHIFFVISGAYMIRRNINIFLVIIVTLILHTLSDMFIVYVIAKLFNIEILKGKTMAYVQYIIGIGTSIHHLADFAVATIIYIPLSKANSGLVKYNFK